MYLIDDSDEHFPRREAYDEARREKSKPVVRGLKCSQTEPRDSLDFQIPVTSDNPLSHYERFMK